MHCLQRVYLIVLLLYQQRLFKTSPIDTYYWQQRSVKLNEWVQKVAQSVVKITQVVTWVVCVCTLRVEFANVNDTVYFNHMWFVIWKNINNHYKPSVELHIVQRNNVLHRHHHDLDQQLLYKSMRLFSFTLSHNRKPNRELVKLQVD